MANNRKVPDLSENETRLDDQPENESRTHLGLERDQYTAYIRLAGIYCHSPPQSETTRSEEVRHVATVTVGTGAPDRFLLYLLLGGLPDHRGKPPQDSRRR